MEVTNIYCEVCNQTLIGTSKDDKRVKMVKPNENWTYGFICKSCREESANNEKHKYE